MIKKLTSDDGYVESILDIHSLQPCILSTGFCIHTLFEQQVTKTPNKTALVFRKKVYTYLELNTLVNQLAFWLKQRYTIMPDKIIGIMLDRSDKMVIGVLAILKAGGAYLPLDQNIPAERNAFICTDAAVDIILTDNVPVNKSPYSGIDFIDLNRPEVFIGCIENPSYSSHPSNIAYVIFTSGSTGKPKGVMVEHRSIVNFLNDNICRYNNSENDIVLGLNSFFFDVSIWELFIPLVTGNCLCVLEPEAHKYPEKIFEACVDNKITLFFLTPVVLQLFLSYLEANPGKIHQLSSLRRIIAGGEVLTPKLVNIFNKLVYKQIGTRLSNIYGPTETTVWVTVFECESKIDLDIVPIGKPISNTEVYILCGEGSLLPDGEAGELVIGGVQVARGYLNHPELDIEKFVQNPYRPCEKMYRTGDLARYLPDGNIEFLGRIDNQVKLNGFRIELNEVENVVLSNPHIKECVVLMRKINNDNELVVYYTVTNKGLDKKGVKDELTTDLPQILPGYMVPSFFVELSAFPVTTNGKIDRRNLPLPLLRYQRRKVNFIPPSSETEKAIALLLIKNLKVENIGIEDNIFDLGVKSLMVTKVIIQINSSLDTNLTLPVFFQKPTIKQLADYVESNHSENKNPFVLLRAGKGDPLFMLPGAHGGPLTFIDFISNYKINQSIYSISYPEDNVFEFESIPLYAEYLITHIKVIQPSGPYNFLGYSFGGNISFEIAAQLQKAGDRINLLAIVSADAPLKKNLLLNYKLSREFGFLLRPDVYLLKKYLKHRIPFLYKKLINRKVSIKHGIPDNSPKTKTVKLWETYQTNFKYNGTMLLIYEDIKKSSFLDFELLEIYSTSIMPKLWRSRVHGKIEKYKFNCLHGDFFSEPLVKDLTNIVQKYFNTIR